MDILSIEFNLTQWPTPLQFQPVITLSASGACGTCPSIMTKTLQGARGAAESILREIREATDNTLLQALTDEIRIENVGVGDMVFER